MIMSKKEDFYMRTQQSGSLTNGLFNKGNGKDHKLSFDCVTSIKNRGRPVLLLPVQLSQPPLNVNLPQRALETSTLCALWVISLVDTSTSSDGL